MTDSVVYRACFVLVVCTALWHGLAQSTIRPMFQVSDEISYFAGAQEHALSIGCAGAEAQEPVAGAAGGKPAFRTVAGWLHCSISRRLAPSDAVIVMRAVLSLSHLAVALATWMLSRRLYPGEFEIALVASLLVAWQPVLASVNSGITPDALANVVAAWAIVISLAKLGTGSPWPALGVAAALAVLAFAFKDNAFVVLVFVGGVAAVELAREKHGRWWAAAGIAVVLLSVVLVFVVARGYSATLAASNLPFVADPSLIPRVLDAAVRMLPETFLSYWTQYGNVGAHQIFVSTAWNLSISAVCALALWGGVRSGPRPSSLARVCWRATVLAVAVALLLQPLRTVAIGVPDYAQGRWLFPLVCPLSVAMAVGLRRALGTAEATVAVGTFSATIVGLLPFLGVVVPFFYRSFPSVYQTANLYLQGPYGQGADPARAMEFLGQPMPTLLYLRTISFVMLVLLGISCVAVGATWKTSRRVSN
jgi:hypothetical protein